MNREDSDMSECIQFTYTSVTGQELEARKWVPEGKIKGIIQLVHGMAEHIDRYHEVGNALAGAGYLTVGHTYLGHGGKAKIHGYFGDNEGWQYLIDDVDGLRKQITAEYPDLPYVVLGHSMGSFIVRCYLTQYGEGLAASVLSGTGYYSRLLVTAGLAVANLVCLSGGKRKPSPLINQIGFATANKPFEPARTPFDWLCRSEEKVDEYIADPNCGFLFTGAGYREMFRGLKRLTHTEDLTRVPAELPVLFISGGNDPIGDMGKGVRKVAEDFEKAGMKNITVKLYPGARHEMFNETNREEAYADLIAWLDRTL